MNDIILEQRIKSLKDLSGTHSPSIETIKNSINNIEIKVDACFLSNPYATDLFLRHLEDDLLKTGKLRDVLEFYPPQNRDIAKNLANVCKISEKNIFVGNGAIEIIQAVIHKFVKGRFAVTIPTFSSYYEFTTSRIEVVFYKLLKENKFEFKVDDYLKFIKDEKIESLTLINPNNPNGGFLSMDELLFILDNTKKLDLVIIDESFIHFAYEDDNLKLIESQLLINKYPNLIIVKSMSKDFGIAGIRAGYALMQEAMVSELLNNGFLWNSSGLAAYFFNLYGSNIFRDEYELIRKKYIMTTKEFFKDLESLTQLVVYPSKANFALVELPKDINSFSFMIKLLINHGIYVRDCSDKIGLDGNFLRIASRTFEENLLIVNSLKKVFDE